MKKLIAVLILLAGVLIRLPHLSDPPLDFHPTRQYRSAIIARGYALDWLPHLSKAEREAARIVAQEQPAIEPPIMEHAAALAYRAWGAEDLRIPRFLAVLSWSAGALAVWWLAVQLFGGVAAPAAALALCLFIPFGIAASQSFQPDPLMTALAFVAVAAAVSHDTRRDPMRLMLLLVSGAAAIFVKPMAAFFIWPVVVALAVRRSGWTRGVIFAAVSSVVMAVPATAWYVLAAPDAAEGRVFPQLLRSSAFWLNWLRMIDIVVWTPLALLGLIGAVAARGRARAVALSLWAGYAAFGVVFTYHIHTHTYYSLPLIPVVGLSVAGLVDRVDRRLRAGSFRRAAAWVAVGVLIGGAALSIQHAGVLRPATELEQQASDYERIGDLVDHSTNVATLDGYYALPLEYHGLLVAHNWPLSIDRYGAALSGHAFPSSVEQLASETGDFFVPTVQSELELEPELVARLDERYPLIDRGGPPDHWRYLLFDLKHRKEVTTTPSKVSLFALVDGSAASDTRVAISAPDRLSWRLVVPDPKRLRVQPDSGTGPATVTLLPLPSDGERDDIVELVVYAGDVSTPAARLMVRVRSLSKLPTSPPFGAVDAPPPDPPIVLGGAGVQFHGWALDAFDSRGVQIEALDADGRSVLLGSAPGTTMRPDVTKLFPNFHDVLRAGWVFTLTPKMIDSLKLPVTIRIFSQAGSGSRSEIGARRVAGF